MSELPFDPADPPEEPPPGVSQIMAWRLAVRLHRDHSPAVVDPARPAVCRACADPWPCHGRRLAWRALLAAARTAPEPPRPPGGAEQPQAEADRSGPEPPQPPAGQARWVSTEWEGGGPGSTVPIKS